MNEPVRVLHVDDDPEVTTLVSAFLEREEPSMSVVAASSAADGLDVLADEPVDCVVSDHEMPGMDGIAFLEVVRERHGDLPFILFTGRGSEEVAGDAVSSGVTDYLRKGGGADKYALLANRIEKAVESHRSRRELARQRDRLLLFFERSPLGAIEWDDSFRVVRMNDRAERILGYTEDELRGKSWTELVPADERPRVEDTVEALLDAEDATQLVNAVRRDDGERIVCEWHNRALTEDGETVAVFSKFQDVTERVTRDRKLDRLREYSRDLMLTRTVQETAEIAVAAADEAIGAPLTGLHLVQEDEDRIAPGAVADSVGEAFDEPPSYERGAPPGSRAALVWDVFETGDRIRLDDVAASDEITEETPAGSVIVHPVGEHGVFIISAPAAHAFTDTDDALADILTRTLTAALDRIERDRERLERERRLERLHRATRDLLVERTPSSVAERAVAAAEEILGFSIVLVRLYDPDVGGLVPVAESGPVDDLLPERSPFMPSGNSLNWRAYEAGETRVYDDIHGQDDAVDAGTPLRSLLILPLGDHGTISVGGTEPGAFDETEVSLAGILATAVETALDAAERERELRQQRDELADRNQRLERFADVVSHDLRNPLGVARGRLELARADGDGAHLEAVERAHDRMESLIDDLLSLSLAGETIDDVEPVALRAVAESAWEHVETDGATLRVHTDRSVEADPGRLRQLFENLFRNAVEHGVPDTAAGADPSIAVVIGDCPAVEGFYVEDDGRGIPEADRGRVFDTGVSTTANGTGFGLSIVREIAEAHGWQVDVTAGDAGGARFEIRFE